MSTIRDYKLPENILLGEVKERIKKYDIFSHRLEQIFELQKIFNQYDVTVEPICGFCSQKILDVMDFFRDKLKEMGCYES